MSEAQRARRTTAFSAVQLQESFAKEKQAEFDTYSDGFSAKLKDDSLEKRKPDWLTEKDNQRMSGKAIKDSPRQMPIQRSSPDSHGIPPFTGEKPQPPEQPTRINKTITVDRKAASSIPNVPIKPPRTPLGTGEAQSISRSGGSGSSRTDPLIKSDKGMMDAREREQRSREQRKLFTKTVALDNRFINNLMSNDKL